MDGIRVYLICVQVGASTGENGEKREVTYAAAIDYY